MTTDSVPQVLSGNSESGPKGLRDAGFSSGCDEIMMMLLKLKREADAGFHRAQDVPVRILERAASICNQDCQSEEFAEGVRAAVDYSLAKLSWLGYLSLGLDQERH